MYKFFLKFFYLCSELFLTLKIPSVVTEIKNIVKEEQLWKDKKRKSKWRRITENIIWYLRHGEPCKYYNSYGFDIVGFRNKKEYLPYRRFRIERNLENYWSHPYYPFENRTCILRDKILFSAFYGKALGAKYVVEDLGMIRKNGSIRCFQLNRETTIRDIFKRHNGNIFIKRLDGECGEGCYIFQHGQYPSSQFMSEIKGSEYIIQKAIRQHDVLSKINPSCVNTIRIVTVMGRNDRRPHILSHMLRVGINTITDNRATGGLAVCIDNMGVLAREAVGHHSIVLKHPVTGVIFEGIQLPFWNEVKELAIRAHDLLPRLGSVGWDIAISPEGSILLEGNDNWEICGPQDTAGGLKQKWYELHNN